VGLHTLHAKIGDLTLENDFISAALGKAGRSSSTPTRTASSPSAAFTGLLADNAIRTSMDGRGSWRDNVFVERLWRSVNKAVYLRAYECVAEARSSIGEYFGFYDRKRPHSSLDGRTPDHVYFAGLAVAGRLGISPPLRGIA
jgi:putative transposase